MSIITKKALAASLKKLMQYKPITKITVKDIVADCEVGRKTFYYHFQDIYELLGWIYITEGFEGLSDCKTYETWPTGLRKMVDFVYTNQIFCKNAYYSIGRERAINFLYPILHKLLINIIDELTEQVQIEKDDKDFIADFYVYAFLGLIIKWSLSDIDDPDQFMNKLIVLVENDLQQCINKFVK